MEDRVELLEGELLKVGESLQLLSHHYNILQHFLQQQFGQKFQEFYEKELESGDGGAGDQQFYEENQGTDGDEEEAYIREFEVTEGAEGLGEEEEDGDTDEGPGLGDLLDVQMGEGDDDEDEDTPISPPAVVVTMGSPDPPKSRPQVRTASGNVNGRKQVQQAQRSPVPRVTPTVVKSGRPPPPLLKRPIPSSSSPVRRVPSANNGVRQVSSSNGSSQRTVAQKTAPLVMKPTFRRTTNGALVPVDPKAFQDDLNGGKYGRYYRKVNSELIQCKICNKVLKRRGKFVQHLRTHTGEKPFTCQYCGATFSRRDNMNVHMQRHHPSDPLYHGNGGSGGTSPHGEAILNTSSELVCYMCYKPLRNQGEYNTHLQKEHGLKAEEEDDDDEMYNDGEGQEEGDYAEDGGESYYD